MGSTRTASQGAARPARRSPDGALTWESPCSARLSPRPREGWSGHGGDAQEEMGEGVPSAWNLRHGTFNARSDEIAEKHNAKFAVRPRIDDSRFVPIMMPDEELGILLSIRHRRTVHKRCCVQYDNKRIRLIKDDGTVLELGSKAEIEVRLTSDGEIYGCYDHKYHRTRTVEEVTDDIASSFPSAREMNEGDLEEKRDISLQQTILGDA